MTYAQAIQFLYDLQMFGTKLGLENTFKLAELAGEPQKKLRFIHVAGTNGKGSTCAILESIYRAAGLRVGLFTSPHLVSFAERIQVNRELIPESEVARLTAEFKPLLERFSPGHCPTFFEVVTIMALKYFAQQNCDLVIWETGMGGRLDATNIVTPLASVITNIQFDHQQWLGDTIEKIAAEKAGIIKPLVPVITASDDAQAVKVISEAAIKNNSPLTLVTAADARSGLAATARLPLIGEHQRLNAALALATVAVLQKTIAVREEQMRVGLETVSWAGRLQIVSLGEGEVLLDGAHNEAGATILRRALEQNFPNARPTLILGVLRDKAIDAVCNTLAPVASRIFLVRVGSERTAEPADLAPICRQANSAAEVNCYPSLQEALQHARHDPFVVITGSLYLVGEALELLSPERKQSERGLNEWSGTPSSDAAR